MAMPVHLVEPGGRAAIHNSREGLRNHERTVLGVTAGVPLSLGAAGMRFSKALAWPISALLVLLGATNLLRAVRPDEEQSTSPDREADQ